MNGLGPGQFGIGERVAAIGNDRTRGGGKAVAEAGVSSPSTPIIVTFCSCFMTCR